MGSLSFCLYYSVRTHGGATLLCTVSVLATHLLQLAVNMLDYQINGHHIPTTLEGKTR